ncbi:MAG TPA: T9SS type A sorting domain-containing protein [Chitinophagales bacterium]|nr:T9SS type A sorting domain-containing protein [Chitinophagales bacterium]HMZ88245.1 T9SS type A sorting domain-containing protein [Chitinophagales bacterium]HNA56766.1 T9SS type A sorting domain-containing protein [Chitinophagales bacterium]HNE45560.1 T9SS type A sorting domain-containing protein [Chitinophagales bacterium]HNF67758.1 T9SS type A sorting domain-containing protein [Chitinophagales bacterium]
MKKSFTTGLSRKNLAAYSSMAGTFLLLHTSAQGQVGYTDLDPDETLNPLDVYDLDMDNNGDIDFTFNFTTFTLPDFFYTVAYHSVYFDGLFNVMKIYPTPGNGVVAYPLSTTGGATLAYAEALNAGADIDGGQAFYTNSAIYMGAFLSVKDYPGVGSNYQFYTFGAWPGKTGKFVGVRFEGDGNEYYGWVRVSVNNDDLEITIDDYAYLSTPETAIEAGQLPTAIHNIDPSQLNVYANGNIINIGVNELNTTSADVNVYDIQGRVVYSNGLNMSGMQITLDAVATGTYTVKITTAEGANYAKRVLINQ